MLCYGTRLSGPFVSYTQRKGTVITMKENQEKKSKLSGLGATLQLGNKPLWKERVSCFKKLSSGTIKSEWTVEDGKFRLFAEVPFNTSAVITLPNGEMHEVQSGKYSFKTDLKI